MRFREAATPTITKLPVTKEGARVSEPDKAKAWLNSSAPLRAVYLLKKKSRRSDRDFEVFVSVRRKKRRQDSELKLQVGVFGYRRGVCLDLLHQSHTAQPTDRLCGSWYRVQIWRHSNSLILTNSETHPS